MGYEIPNNMSISGLDTCELLWSYDGSNYSSSPTDGFVIPLDITHFSLLLIIVRNVTSGDKNTFLVVNDTTSPYNYILAVAGRIKEIENRRLTINMDGLAFSGLYNGDYLASSDDYTLCIPYQIYGIR